METGYKNSTKINHVGVDNFQWFGERIMVGKRGAFFMLAVITAAAFHVLGLHGSFNTVTVSVQDRALDHPHRPQLRFNTVTVSVQA